ncbi:MAG: SDR family oxidoreductase, partial [Chloroflexota bacterium]|nr:SDR family oxidoreductase [Chloroflexota bacterium]
SVVVCDPGVARDGTGVDARPADEVVALIKKGGGQAVPSYESVADFAAAERIIKTGVDKFGRLDILVNCAGILRERMIFNMTEEEWDAVLDVHLKGTWNCCRHACVLMRQQRGGRIINTTSSAWLGTVGQSNYGSAKGGIVSLTRAVAREMGRYGVTCNAIDPAAATRMTMDARVKEGLRKRLEAGIITREFYEGAISVPGPEYVPPFVLYLASDAAAPVNGQVFHVAADRVSIYSNPVETRALYKNYQRDGKFSLDELITMVPKTLLVGYINPAPPEPPEK